MVSAQLVHAPDIPLHLVKQVHQEVVETDPGAGDTVERDGAGLAHGGYRNDQLDQGENRQHGVKHQGIQQDHQGRQGSLERRGQEIKHSVVSLDESCMVGQPSAGPFSSMVGPGSNPASWGVEASCSKASGFRPCTMVRKASS